MADNPKIKIIKDGPYKVSGDIPLKEGFIVPHLKGYVLKDGKTFDHEETYYLCRCGHSKTMPFCDGSHAKHGFDGTETASRKPYEERAAIQEGEGINLADDGRCSLYRFCHGYDGHSAWELTDMSADKAYADAARFHASECAAGRLTIIEKNGEVFENEYEKEIYVIQDPEKGVSSGFVARGGIDLEAADGELYENRNRYMLCRCGESKTKPFCRADHILSNFDDGHIPNLDDLMTEEDKLPGK
ncbi:MAG: CDGSH iron-sulfur domain-containing protein [Coriobacteriia bacterium]|nr:CDGSH iron-sulfur domain-containing protein [Coriobacteriia bacterium]